MAFELSQLCKTVTTWNKFQKVTLKVLQKVKVETPVVTFSLNSFVLIHLPQNYVIYLKLATQHLKV